MFFFFFFNDTATTEIYTLSLHDALPISRRPASCAARGGAIRVVGYLEHPREGVITMNCPACGTAMTEIAVSDVKIQACKGGCGGLWFDEWTLRKVDQPDQSAGEALLHIEQNAAVKLDP